MKLISQGAEARLFETTFLNRHCVCKERFRKTYRHPTLDSEISSQRTIREARLLAKCRKMAIRAPAVLHVDVRANKIYLEFIDGVTMKEFIARNPHDAGALQTVCRQFGAIVATLHNADIIHGDLTTSNVMIEHAPPNNNSMNIDSSSSSTATTATTATISSTATSPSTTTAVAPSLTLVLIDLGLGDVSTLDEDKAVDLYVLARAMTSAHPQHDPLLFDAFLAQYKLTAKNGDRIIAQYQNVQLRGRKKVAFG